MSLTAVLILLSYYFYNPDFDLQYVFDRSSLSTPTIYRLSAVWAGQAGTFLLWSWAIVVPGVFLTMRREKTSSLGLAIVYLGSAFFSLMGLLSDPFKQTLARVSGEAARAGVSVEMVLQSYANGGMYDPLKGFIDGLGLSPMLQTPYNAIHPPLMFLAYGFLFLVFAFSLAHLWDETNDWEAPGRGWARISWLFMSLAMVIGGLWAYEELAFGFYWTWDPIEAASVLPWLTLTAYLHGSVLYRRKKALEVLTPCLGVLTTLLIVYSTYITRSGVIKSSHAYTETSGASYLIITVGLVAALAFFLALRRLDRTSLSLGASLESQATLLLLGILGMLVIAGVVFYGLTNPLFAKLLRSEDIRTLPDFYNQRGFYPVLITLFIAGYTWLLGFVEKKRVRALAAVTIVISALFGLTSIPSESLFMNLSLPVILLATLAVGTRFYHSLGRRRSSVWARLSSDITHLGLVILILGIMASGSLGKSYTRVFDFNTERSSFVPLDSALSVSFNEVKVFQDERGRWVQDGFYTFSEGERQVNGKSRMISDPRGGSIHDPGIHRGLSDLYVLFHGVSHSENSISVPFTFKVLPLLSLVWIGSFFLVLGMISLLIIERL